VGEQTVKIVNSEEVKNATAVVSEKSQKAWNKTTAVISA
jgi:hypothetical protein